MKMTVHHNLQVMDGYFVHFLAPKGLDPIPMDIVFVFDKSGSMEPLKISQLKAAMFRILDDVKPTDRISMISFSHSVHDWGRGMIPADNTNILAAKQFVKEQMAFGGTHLFAEQESLFFVMSSDFNIKNENVAVFIFK